MRQHTHTDRLAGSPRELAGDRHHYAGMDAAFLTGGAGMVNAQPGPAPPNANGIIARAGGETAHLGVIGFVILAALVLFILDRAGFRFAVTAGKR